MERDVWPKPFRWLGRAFLVVFGSAAGIVSIVVLVLAGVAGAFAALIGIPIAVAVTIWLFRYFGRVPPELRGDDSFALDVGRLILTTVSVFGTALVLVLAYVAIVSVPTVRASVDTAGAWFPALRMSGLVVAAAWIGRRVWQWERFLAFDAHIKAAIARPDRGEAIRHEFQEAEAIRDGRAEAHQERARQIERTARGRIIVGLVAGMLAAIAVMGVLHLVVWRGEAMPQDLAMVLAIFLMVTFSMTGATLAARQGARRARTSRDETAEGAPRDR